jgi:aldose 1-epimerase
MNFSVQKINKEDLLIYRLTDHQLNTYVEVLPAYGALLHGFSIQTPEGSVNVIDHYTDKTDAETNLGTSFKSSKLSPFVCRIPNGKYEWQGEELEFKQKFMDGSAIHGLLYNKSFNIVEDYCNEKQAALRLKYQYKKEDPGYPYNYVCEVVYTLHAESVLQIESIVYNLSETPIPLSDGWHPYFSLGNTINEYELQFSSEAMLEFDEKLIPTGNLIAEPRFHQGITIGDTFLDNCFELSMEEGLPVCILHNPKNNLSLLIYTNSNYPYLQIYTPDHRKSIAIENLSSAPDAFNNGMGIKVLMPRATETFNVWYKLQVN